MKARKIFVTIDFDNVPGVFVYPRNLPIPHIGEKVTMDGINHGKVYDIHHVITGSLDEIKIKVSHEQ